MKNLILSLVIIASVITSCSNDETTPTTSQYSKVIATIGIGENAFPSTRANVNRGTIPTTINRITVDVVNNNPAFIPTQTVFDLVNSGGASQFLIENVASGGNTFTAKAATTGASKLSVTPYEYVSDADTDAKIKAAQDAVPYANYTAIAGLDVILGQAQEIRFPMLTSNGRLIGTVETSPLLSASGRKITVTEQRFAEDNTPVGDLLTFDITGGKSVIAVWNDASAIQGSYIGYVVKVYNDAAGTNVEKTFEKKIVIKASTGITSKTTISSEGLTESINYGTFTFPTWTEENH